MATWVHDLLNALSHLGEVGCLLHCQKAMRSVVMLDKGHLSVSEHGA